MENWVDLLGFGQAELIDDGGQNLSDGEWFFPLRGEFGVGDEAFQISGFQPDFVSFNEGFETFTRADMTCRANSCAARASL